MIGRIHFRIVFLKIFKKNGSKLNSLYELGESDDLPDLTIMIIAENFHRTGKYKSLNM